MLVGLGAGATLPSVISGYLGNPWGSSGWIESSLAQGQTAGRWPDTALELDSTGAAAGLKWRPPARKCPAKLYPPSARPGFPRRSAA